MVTPPLTGTILPGITRDSTMKRMDRAKWSEVIDVNLGGVFNMAGPLTVDGSGRLDEQVRDTGVVRVGAGKGFPIDS